MAKMAIEAHEKTFNIANYQRNANQNYREVEWPSSRSLQIINAAEGMEKSEPSYTVGGTVNWCSHYETTVWRFLKKLKIELPYDPAIPLLGIYPEKMKT